MGFGAPHQCSLGTAACLLLVMLTCTLLTTSSHSEGRTMSLQGWFGWTDYRAQSRVKPGDGYMCEGDAASCAAPPINTFTAPVGHEIYSLEVGPSGNRKLTSVHTRPIGAESCHAGKHCNDNGVAFGNTADGCRCMCSDGYGGDDCSCDKSPDCLGATVIRARAANVAAVPYVEIEHPDGSLEQYGDTSFHGQTNEELRLLPDECLVSVEVANFPSNHEWGGAVWDTWKFVTSKSREFAFRGWWRWNDGQCVGGTCETPEASTVTAPVGESIHTLKFDSILTGYASYPCGGAVPTKPPTYDDMYAQKAGVGTWGGTCTCPSGNVYYVGDNNDNCGSLACNGGVAGACSSSLPQSGWRMSVECGVPPPTEPTTTAASVTVQPAETTPKPTTTPAPTSTAQPPTQPTPTPAPTCEVIAVRGKCKQSTLGCSWRSTGCTTAEPADPECALFNGNGQRGACLEQARGCRWVGATNSCHEKETESPPSPSPSEIVCKETKKGRCNKQAGCSWRGGMCFLERTEAATCDSLTTFGKCNKGDGCKWEKKKCSAENQQPVTTCDSLTTIGKCNKGDGCKWEKKKCLEK